MRSINHSPRALATVAMLALGLTACGDKEKEVVATNDAPAATPITSPSESSGVETGTVKVDYSNVSYETAESTYMDRRYDEATRMFEGYVQRKPDNPWGHYMLGLSAWKSGDLDRARSALERSHELDPTHVKTLLNLSRVLLDQKMAGEAKERVEAALALDSTSGEVYRMLGRVHTALGQPDEAIDAYRTALTIDPGEAWSMNNLALIYIQQERFEEALGPLARAVQLRPGSPIFQNNLGVALEATGHIGAAREAFLAATAADSSYVKAQVSAKRVEGLEDDPMVEPVELEVLADAFEREVQRWRDERMAVVVPDVSFVEQPESLTIVPDSMPIPPR